MTRPLRIEYSNAYYHVMNRGRRRDDIFNTNEDRIAFLSLLNEIHQKFNVEIHAYCLMDNHYHLLLKTPLSNLQRAMRHLGSVYTQRFNRANNIDGALFRGRYKAKLIEKEGYFIRVSRYIHLNPVSACITKLPEEYEWSSCKEYLQSCTINKWLYCEETLSCFGGNNDELRISRYRDYLGEDIGDDLCQELDPDNGKAILGSDEFVEKMAKKIKAIEVEEIPEQKPVVEKIIPSMSLIENFILHYYKISSTDIRKSRQNLGNMPRQVAIYLMVKHTKKTHQEIANHFGNISRYAVSQAYYRILRFLDGDPLLANELLDIERKMRQNNVEFDLK